LLTKLPIDSEQINVLVICERGNSPAIFIYAFFLHRALYILDV